MTTAPAAMADSGPPMSMLDGDGAVPAPPAGDAGPATPGGTGDTAVVVPAAARVAFGIDALGRWRVEVRDHRGALLQDPAAGGAREAPLDLAGYPTDDPAAAVALQQALRVRFPGAQVLWRPGVMGSLDETTAAAHRALAAAGADREAARAAADTGWDADFHRIER